MPCGKNNGGNMSDDNFTVGEYIDHAIRSLPTPWHVESIEVKIVDGCAVVATKTKVGTIDACIPLEYNARTTD